MLYAQFPCGKMGCDNLAVTQGYRGSLRCYACEEHARELTDLLGGPLPGKITAQPTPYPNVVEYAQSKIAVIDRRIEELKAEKQRLQKRIAEYTVAK